jgi:hypothetical protein
MTLKPAFYISRGLAAYMTDHPQGFFQGTEMPTAGWWEALWPDPAAVLAQ